MAENVSKYYEYDCSYLGRSCDDEPWGEMIWLLSTAVYNNYCY